MMKRQTEVVVPFYHSRKNDASHFRQLSAVQLCGGKSVRRERESILMPIHVYVPVPDA
jgi:hypothetical protein